MTASPHVLVVASFDSQLKWCAGLRDELVARGATSSAVAPRGRSALSRAQVRAAGFEHVEPVDPDDLVERCLTADVVVCALAGPQVRRLGLELAARAGDDAPVLVVGWVGVIIEKLTAGYLDRCGADVVAVNARHELDHFRHVAQRLGLPDDNLLLSGLPFLSGSPAPQQDGPVRTVLWADQPTVPTTPADRAYVYGRLLDHARRHPERSVLLKPRHRPGEDTFHRMRHAPEDLLAGMDLPANFQVVHTPITELLATTDLMLTTSSTACLEALDRGCRVALVADLGVHESLGNHVFVDSGLLRTFDQVDADDLGTPDPVWAESVLGSRSRTPAALVADRVEELLASGERPSRAVRRTPYLRAVADVERVRADERVAPAGAWRRRRAKHGSLVGTGVHLALDWGPPALVRPVRQSLRRRVVEQTSRGPGRPVA